MSEHVSFEAGRQARTIYYCADHLIDMVSELPDLSQLASDKVVREPIRLRANDLALQTLKSMRRARSASAAAA